MLFLTVGYLLYLWDGISDELAKAKLGSTADLSKDVNSNQNNVNKNVNASNANLTNNIANSTSNKANTNANQSTTANTNQLANTNQTTNVNQNTANSVNTNSVSNTNQNGNANATPTPTSTIEKRSILGIEYGKNGQILWLLIFAGSLGALIRCLYNFFTFWGSSKFDFNWIWYYLISPFIGGSLALVFYFIIRGGFFTVNNDWANLNNINLYSFTGLSMLVGLFSREALKKLQDIAETVFVKVERPISEMPKTNNSDNNNNDANSDSVSNNSKTDQTNVEEN